MGEPVTTREAAPATARARLAQIADGLARQRHLIAVRDGVVASLPLVLVGSAFLLLAQPPIPSLAERIAPWADRLLVPYRVLGGAIGLYVCFAVARRLAQIHALDELGASLVAVATFLVTVGTVPTERGGWGFPLAGLGPGGLFGAIAIALASVEIQRLVARRGWILRLPPSVPEAIAKSFEAIVPALASIGLAWTVVHLLGADPIGAVSGMLAPVVAATDSLPGAWALVAVDSLLWLLGIHPVAILGAVKPIWLSMLTENMAAAADGLPLPHVATREFFLWFVWQGGSGGTLALALLLVRAKSEALRAVGKVGFVPAVFNVNEPILFGLPVVMNPRLAIPFVAAPLVTATIAYLAMAVGWVERPHLEVLWTLPAPVGAWLATGGDARAIGLQMANLGIALAIWWPFVRAWDRRLAEEGRGAIPMRGPDDPRSESSAAPPPERARAGR